MVITIGVSDEPPKKTHEVCFSKRRHSISYFCAQKNNNFFCMFCAQKRTSSLCFVVSPFLDALGSLPGSPHKRITIRHQRSRYHHKVLWRNRSKGIERLIFSLLLLLLLLPLILYFCLFEARTRYVCFLLTYSSNWENWAIFIDIFSYPFVAARDFPRSKTNRAIDYLHWRNWCTSVLFHIYLLFSIVIITRIPII